jgi:hypothetical protein
MKVNTPGPAIRYHGTCLILWFQSIWFCSAVSSIFGRTVVSTTVTKNRWQGPLNLFVRQQSVTSKKCMTAHIKQQILIIILHVPPSLGRAKSPYQTSHRISKRISVLSADINLQGFCQDTCKLDNVLKFELYHIF